MFKQLQVVVLTKKPLQFQACFFLSVIIGYWWVYQSKYHILIAVTAVHHGGQGLHAEARVARGDWRTFLGSIPELSEGATCLLNRMNYIYCDIFYWSKMAGVGFLQVLLSGVYYFPSVTSGQWQAELGPEPVREAEPRREPHHSGTLSPQRRSPGAQQNGRSCPFFICLNILTHFFWFLFCSEYRYFNNWFSH